ncbi:hypothetical protein D3C76_1558740 [compost metagenome]
MIQADMVGRVSGGVHHQQSPAKRQLVAVAKRPIHLDRFGGNSALDQRDFAGQVRNPRFVGQHVQLPCFRPDQFRQASNMIPVLMRDDHVRQLFQGEPRLLQPFADHVQLTGNSGIDEDEMIGTP